MFARSNMTSISATSTTTATHLYNDFNASSTHSYDSDAAFHIYNELQLPQEPSNAIVIGSSNISSTNLNSKCNNTSTNGIIYGFRTRHLSCIEENDSDSLHSSSLPPPPYDLMQQADETFKRLQEAAAATAEDPNNSSFISWPDDSFIEPSADEMPMLDESRLFELDYFDELSISKSEVHQAVRAQEYADEEEEDEGEEEDGAEMATQQLGEYWQSTVSEPLHLRPPRDMLPDIMTTSCYGALNSAFGNAAEATSTPTKQQQQATNLMTPEPVYATPEKQRREFNRSFDSSCHSQCSSLYGGGLEQQPPWSSSSMTSSLDLKYMTASAMASSMPLDLSAEGMHLIEWPPTAQHQLQGAASATGKANGTAIAAAADDLNDEMAKQCLHAAEHDLQSIRRLLEHEANDSVCPSCRISFDKGKRRRLIDTCGHERCYSCMFRNDQCPMCMNSSLKDVECNNAQGYDTGIGGSTSTIVSPLGSPQPQLRSQVQRSNAAALAKYMQLQRPESISPECRFASNEKTPRSALLQTQTVTVDVHQNQNPGHNFGEINAATFATPPTRRRFFNHQKLRSALTGHRRTASNGSPIDTGSTLTAGSDSLSIDHAIASSADKQKDQLRARLGLLLDSDQNSNQSTTNSSSSTNISPEQTLFNGCQNVHNVAVSGVGDKFSSQLSVSNKDQDCISVSSKFKACSLTDSNGGYEAFPVKVRKAPARRSARTGQLMGASKRNGIYKGTNVVPQPAAVQLALKPLFFEVPLQEPDPPFIGRQWLLRELSNILTATETPGVLINGHPGSGKTALLLQLVEYSCFGRRKDDANSSAADTTDGIYCQINLGHDRLRALASHIVGYHFCQADSNSTCLVPDFVHSLAAQLCQAPQLIAYREYLINEPHLQDILGVKECIADAERVMRMAILEPLTILKRSGKINSKTCIILVDALCEAEYHRPDHGHTIATFLAKMTQFFPSWLKVVATVRTQMLEFVKGFSYTKMTLDSWASNDLLQKDMLDYITFRINHSTDIQNNIAAVKDNSTSQLKFVGHLQTLSKGSMLYAKLILDLIERGQLVIKSTSYKVLPVSIAQIFLLHFNLRFPTASSFEKASPILNVCLAALYPLTLSEIYYTISAMKTDEMLSWDEFLQRFQLLDGFLIKRIDNTYMFFHPSFREWLIRRDEGESTKFVCDFRLGHAAIAFRLSRLQAPLDAEQTLELGHHMLKAHIYRQCQGPQSPRDIQSVWVASVTDNISAALGSLRNVYNPNIKVSRLMLLSGACPHYQTEFMGDATILCLAAYEGIVPMVSLLLEFGADVERTNSQGCTPLILAAMRGHCDVVRLLVAAGSSLGQTDTTQRCALVHAARMGRLNVVKYLLACDWTPRLESNDVTLSCALRQALIAAAAQDHVTILEDLLEMDDIEINAMEVASGDMALTAAARNGCTDAVAVLLSRGACVDAHNKHGFTALWLAVKEGHWAVAEKLLQNGADPDEAVLSTQKTPLMIAAEEGHTEMLEQLIKNGASLEAQDHEGFTALSWACLRGRQAAAKCLIERGCNKNQADNNGRTALDLAAYQGSAALVQYLLDHGANLEHIDVNGMRPLDRAIACRNIQAVQVFLRRGAKLGPTTWSMAMGKPEILVVLLNKLLEDGNVLYRKNRFQESAHRYQYALRKISNLENLLERSAVFAQLRANLLLNLSRCKRKLNELEESIDLASQAIDQKPSSYEGFYARAKARMEDGQLNEALLDANEAMQKAAASGVPPEVVEVLKRIQTDLLSRISDGSTQQQQLHSQYESYGESAAAFGGPQNEMTDL